MASGEASEPLKFQTWVLKVSIHCEGCKKKVKKVLQNTEGVYHVDIDSKKHKATVTGNVDADTLIKKLLKSGKHAELVVDKKPKSPNLNPNSNSNPNPSGNNANNGDGKNKGADTSKPKVSSPNPEKKQPPSSNDKPTDAAKTDASESPAKPAAEAAKVDTKAPESSSDEPSKPEGKEAKDSPHTPNKPADVATGDTADKPNASASRSGKKKGKKGQQGAGADGESPNFDVVSGNGMDAGNSPPPQLVYRYPEYPPPQPSYPPQPVYSYSTAHPTVSYAYYAPTLMQQPPPQGYYGYSVHAPPESYYVPMDSGSSSSQPGSYDMFSDENANSCKVM